MHRYSVVLAVAVTLTLGSCGAVRETPAHHVVHKGEIAVLSLDKAGPVWIATDRRHSEEVNSAFGAGDQAALAVLARDGKAFSVDNGTRVQVLGEQFNDREVRIVSAANTGKTGWVPFEWLQPPPQSDQ